MMTGTVTSLIVDFLVWLEVAPRDYAEVMEAWRTSCPRLTVWEDTIDAGLITRTRKAGQPERVELTAAGRTFLRQHTR
jgi:hypothetical protein